MSKPKLTPQQYAVLSAAKGRRFFDYYDTTKAGGNGKTLQALTGKGLLVKNDYPDGSKDWSITPAGIEAAASDPKGNA